MQQVLSPTFLTRASSSNGIVAAGGHGVSKKNIGGSHFAWWLLQRDLRLRRLMVAAAGRRRRTLRVAAVGERWKTVVIPMPEKMVVESDQQRAHLWRALDTAAERLREKNTKVRFDFSRVEKIFPGGMLVFLAYAYLLSGAYPGRVAVRASHRSVAGQLLAHVGAYRMLGMTLANEAMPVHEDVVNWKYLTGTGSDGAKINELLEFYRQQVDADIPEGLYDVLAEAFTNVRHHAFRDGSELPEALKRWWLFARYVAPTKGKPGYLYIGIYDIGIGIPESLRPKLKAGEWFLDKADELMKVGGKSLDRALLLSAVEHNRSSTGLKNRGLGLPEMKDFALSTEGGQLYILSGRAQYSCVASVGKGVVYGCSNGFIGTLILWSLPLVQRESA